MEKLELIAEIEEVAKQKGISQTKLDRNVKLSYLPEKGEFVGYEVGSPNTTYAHLRVITDKGYSCSIGALQALAFDGSLEDAASHLREKEANEKTGFPGGFVLGGTTAINPHLSGKMSVVVANLIDKKQKFTTKEVNRIVLPIKTETDSDGKVTLLGYQTKEEAIAALVSKKFYQVTLL